VLPQEADLPAAATGWGSAVCWTVLTRAQKARRPASFDSIAFSFSSLLLEDGEIQGYV
jgi:hypothetical protein